MDGKCYLLKEESLDQGRLFDTDCGFTMDRDIWGLCQYKICETVTRKACIFPFK